MYPELVTRSDLEVFLPPIGGQTLYIFGNPRDLANPEVELTARVHDECNGSDVFGSDICTCRPYLTHAIEECIQGAQRGGVGLVAYSRKEGRALGEVTKFLVYNARKRQVGGDTADQYFARTECVAGVQDMRFQELMPDVLHWLGIRKIHRLVSMSNMKYDAITGSGIEIGERVNIPDELIPADARVEMDAKMAAGYFTPGAVPDAEELKKAKGRGLTMSMDQPTPPARFAADTAPGRRAPPSRSCARTAAPCASAPPQLLARARARRIAPGSRSARRRASKTRRATVAEVTRERYPMRTHPVPQPLAPFRGRRREPQGRARPAAGRRARRASAARAQIDLAVVSVLLDAGAGPDWHYVEPATGQTLHALRGPGAWRASTPSPAACSPATRTARCRPMPPACARWSTDHLADAFQVSEGNPLVGLEGPRHAAAPAGRGHGRAARGVRRRRPARRPVRHAGQPAGPGVPPTADVAAHDILSQHASHRPVAIDLARPTQRRHRRPAPRWATAGATARCAGRGLTDGWMPFHKLSQWLTYSLLEPFEWAGVKVRDLDALTGLPEYRNGGLLLDSGVLVPARPGRRSSASGRSATSSSSNGAR